MNFSVITGLLGGLGLFLIGMRLMTDGLRSAAGPSLRGILGKWTSTPLRGLFTGFMITALVQSSSAITVTTIGFVNAGLMTMAQSVGVIFGSNIGTTITGWIVAAVGVSVDVKVLALPLIGLGALLALTGENSRRKPVGDAMVGFGIFFLGIETLQSSFHQAGSSLDLSTLHFGSVFDILAFVTVGFTLTLLMQSSSAAMALVLTAAMSGLIDLESAAAAVVGTNIGTTTTAMFSVIGATHNAKKVAAAHILFNLVTGAIALFLIPVFLKVARLIIAPDGTSGVAAILAGFHTAFNLLGVILFLPFTHQLVRFLDRRIGRELAELGKPRYLDDNTLQTPTIAMEALFMELGRLGETVRMMAQNALGSKFRHKDFLKNRAAVGALVAAIRAYCLKMQRLELPEPIADKLPQALRVVQYFVKVVDTIDDVAREHLLLDHALPGLASESARHFRREVRGILNTAHTPCAPEFGELEKLLGRLHRDYDELKDALLRLGSQERIELDRMVDLLNYYSRMRVMCEQAAKGTVRWAMLRNKDATCQAATETNEYTWKPEA
ncbi:MAG: Na/Pi symporter [Pseudodesulfovibrio sp.]